MGHCGPVKSAVFSSDRTRVISISLDKTMRIWDIGGKKEITRITLETAITALAVHGSAIALGDVLGRLHVYDAKDFLSTKAPPHA